MFDYQTSKHAHFDAACRAFALSHNLEDVAAAVGMRPQILRNKLNPIQPHRLADARNVHAQIREVVLVKQLFDLLCLVCRRSGKSPVC